MKYLKNDVIRLASTYLAIVMIMSIGFSIIFFNASLRQLNRTRGDDGFVFETSVEHFMQQRAERARQALLVDLIFVNFVTLGLGAVVSYLLARASLRPIEENMEAQSQFVSDASHELRTPLTALRAANEVALRDKKLKLKDARQVIADNVADITRLQDLTNSMLGLLKYDSEHSDKTAVEATEVIEDAVSLVVNQALAKDIAVEPDVKPVFVQGNRQQLIQLVTIFLDNAIKYSAPSKTIRVQVFGKGRSVVFVIQDEGMGMDEATAAHIFTRFYRADASRATSGYGLGLAIAQKIIVAHRGSVTVSSQPGKGSTFTITLPRALR